MTDELVAIAVMGILTMMFGRQILIKKEIKIPKYIDYPVALIAVTLTSYIVCDTFI